MVGSPDGFKATFMLPSGKKVTTPCQSTKEAAMECLCELGLKNLGIAHNPDSLEPKKSDVPTFDPAVVVVSGPPPASSLPTPSFVTSGVQLLPGLPLENTAQSPVRPHEAPKHAAPPVQQLPAFFHPPPPLPNFSQPPPSFNNHAPLNVSGRSKFSFSTCDRPSSPQ
jgi:hypothetical protein